MKGSKMRVGMILAGLLLIGVVLGVWGLVASGKRFLDACHLTLQLITLNAGLEDGEKPWQLEIARFLLPGIGAYVVLEGIFFLAGRHLSALKLELHTKDHYVICGLGDRGMALARDLLKGGKQKPSRTVAAIDIDPGNLHAMLFIKMGGVFLEGDAREPSILKQARIQRAAHLILLTGTDAANLGVLRQVVKLTTGNRTESRAASSALKSHTHLASRENRALFDAGGELCPPIRDGIEMHVFNVYENAAVALFQENILGANTDTVTPGAAPVSVLIAGFGRMGEAVLLEAMQLGHFCNHVPLSLTVFDDNAQSAERHFFQRYREVPDHLGDKGLRLWNLRFVDTLGLDAAGRLGHYSDILACHDDEDAALTCINNLRERWQCEEDRLPTRFFLYSSCGQASSSSVIHPFGDFRQVCSAENVFHSTSKRMAKASHWTYAWRKLRDRDPSVGSDSQSEAALVEHDRSASQSDKLSWKNYSLLKQDSNRTERRHYGIKLHALGLRISSVRNATPDSSLIDPGDFPFLIDSNCQYAPLLLTSSLSATHLNTKELINRIHQLASAEHSRWNAFHVLNNYRYGKTKDECKRTHDCLLNWADLSTDRPQVLKWDYKNIYQMADVLRWEEKGISSIFGRAPE